MTNCTPKFSLLQVLALGVLSVACDTPMEPRCGQSGEPIPQWTTPSSFSSSLIRHRPRGSRAPDHATAHFRRQAVQAQGGPQQRLHRLDALDRGLELRDLCFGEIARRKPSSRKNQLSDARIRLSRAGLANCPAVTMFGNAGTTSSRSLTARERHAPTWLGQKPDPEPARPMAPATAVSRRSPHADPRRSRREEMETPKVASIGNHFTSRAS
jgi:hypothetical protein